MKVMQKKSGKDKSFIMYVSTYPPRECGIATFTKDLTTAMDKKFNPSLKSKILAVNENGSSIYNYGGKVHMQLNESDIENYIEAAKRINKNEKIKLVCIEHEFGLFGGEEYGEFLISFLDKLEKPAVVTFHSILPDPNEERVKVVRSIVKRCKAVTVMAETGVDILSKKYGIDKKKIYVIHHGVPSVDFLENNSTIKKSLGLENRTVLSTFGLINRGKGIEYVIKALPNIVKKFPNLLYLVIGETHPVVRKQEGELYRNKLIKLVERLGLKNNVKFYNKYLSLEEIIEYLKATDIYIYSALEMNQIVSGTLVYAMSAGKAVIATPSIYAKEMLDDERGFVVKLQDVGSMRNAIEKILEDKNLKRTLEKNAYAFTRQMIWPNVAANYLEVFNKLIKVKKDLGLYKLPPLKLNHLFNLTDDTGILQHAKHSMANRNLGYTLDDNARALVVATMHYDLYRSEKSLKLINVYLSYIYHSQKKDGYLHNLMSYNKQFLDDVGSEDSYGRTLWATGKLINSKVHSNLKASAKLIFDNALKNVDELTSVRSYVFSLIGLYHYYKVHKDKNLYDEIVKLADSLVKDYNSNKSEEWDWFEDSLTYSNGKIPEALFLAYEVTEDKKYLEIAEKTLNFLTSLIMLGGKLVLIGHKGWYKRGEDRAYYDQQPVDASSMVQCYVTANRVTGKKKYYDNAFLAFQWFLGKNSLNQIVYDENTGGCYDGLLPECINLNQGAESTISYLLARLNLEK
ncbi:MAG: glycosyl transferase [Nanoarchaeota archaeon]|nr:glycosyl transferase [Nanoarchaeota archaeon]